MRTVIAFIFFLIPSYLLAQVNSLSGEILDENAGPMPSATAILLNPSDSTLQYFGVTNAAGMFEIRNIKNGKYLLQLAFIGYKTIYKNISFPGENTGDIGSIIMIPTPVALDEVTVTGERIPLKIKSDTIEYDAKAFKVAPDGVVEDLLKKLPGLEIDRAGNIKALGEDIRNVLIDGKEFFGNDPKVATKNLPADVVDKVQLYNKKSEEAEFTGIDDGTRNQTLNLKLDENKKKGVFGELMSGGGTGKHYQSNGKVYRFDEKTQLAALGMFNNVNRYGFSVGDYLSFSGGLSAFGGKIIIGEAGIPVNFGETVKGYSTSGAAGLNFSYSPKKNQRFFISYLGNGSKKELTQTSKNTNYREEGSFNLDERTEQVQRDTSHRFNFGARYLFNETNNIIINGNVSYNTGFIPLSSYTSSFINDYIINDQTRESEDVSDRLSGNISTTYLKKIKEGKSDLKIWANGSLSNITSETGFENITNYYNPVITEITSQFQDNSMKSQNLSAGMVFTRRITLKTYLDVIFEGGYDNQDLEREQGNTLNGYSIIDSLSPDFMKRGKYFKPGLSIRRNTEKTNLTLALEYNTGKYSTSLWENAENEKEYNLIQPRFSFEYSYGSGRRIMVGYRSYVTTPTVNQMLPVVNNFNSLSLFYGNPDLKPEIIHRLSSHWWIFDQFSFTSFLAAASIRYTTNKINYSRIINDQLVQVVRLVNVESDFMANANIDFSTPIRALGIKTNINIDETYNNGINLVDGYYNDITTFNHRLSVDFENRKKEKWDIGTGIGLTLTDARYSIQQSLNNVYFDISWFGAVRWTPNDDFNFNLSADITNYTARSFEESQVVPLLGAEISYFFMQNNRAALTLSGFDLLNRNTGIDRISELNYLRETRSNIIGRYIMLSFKYRLNKFGSKDGGINVDIKKR
ncbi:MAG TPA: hypothetical protein DEQ09_12955 [Bacteroidales bacterium]|nr:hypothetical protein [Bacteroidales bacterium]